MHENIVYLVSLQRQKYKATQKCTVVIKYIERYKKIIIIVIPTDSINFFFSSLLPRICLLGSKLLASTSYHECSRNDTLLSQAYGNDEQFWQNNPLSYVNGVPGITSDSFVGEYLTKINCAFKRGPEIKENTQERERILKKVYTARLLPKVQPLTLTLLSVYTNFDRKCTPFVYEL